MKPIIHIITSLNSGGAERMLTRVIVNCAESAPDPEQIVVSLMDEGVYGKNLRHAGVRLYCLNFHSRNKFFAVVQLYKIIRSHKPAVIMTWLYHADLLGTIVGSLAGVRNIVWNVRCSDMDFSNYSKKTWLIVKILALLSKFPKLIVVNSLAGKKTHSELGYKPREWVYVPNGFDLEEFSPNTDDRVRIRNELAISKDEIIVGLIARVDPQKDHATFFKAALLVASEYEKVKFLLVGKGTDTLMIPDQLSDQVLRLGARNDIALLLKGIDVIVLSSAYGEGFPNVLGEAMATGVPCVTTDVGDAANLVENVGEVVNTQDHLGLSKAIVKLINEGPSLRKERSVRGREKISQNYSIKVIYQKYISIFEKFICFEEK